MGCGRRIQIKFSIFFPAAFFAVVLLVPRPAKSAVAGGSVKISEHQLQTGTSFDLTGQWLYRPGYAIATNETPQAGASGECFFIPVPQILNRIRWWLDDS